MTTETPARRSKPLGKPRGRGAANLVDRIFGHLQVLDRAGSTDGCCALWRVMCKRPSEGPNGGTIYCGIIKTVRGTALAHGQMKSCGCARLARGEARTRRTPPAEMQGQVYGLLTCHRLLPSADRNQGARWLCFCACGCQKIARAKDLRNGNTKSCGCLANRPSDWRAEPGLRNTQNVPKMGAGGG